MCVRTKKLHYSLFITQGISLYRRGDMLGVNSLPMDRLWYPCGLNYRYSSVLRRFVGQRQRYYVKGIRTRMKGIVSNLWPKGN